MATHEDIQRMISRLTGEMSAEIYNTAVKIPDSWKRANGSAAMKVEWDDKSQKIRMNLIEPGQMEIVPINIVEIE